MDQKTLVDLIWDGKIFEDDKHVQDMHSSFLKKIKAEGINYEEEITKCKTDEERIVLLKKYFDWTAVPLRYLDRFKKQASLSTFLRKKAFTSYKGGINEPALRGYNLAIAFGRNGEEELGLAYGGRAATLFQIKEPALALKDITRALANKYPPNSQKELLELKTQCAELQETTERRDSRNKVKVMHGNAKSKSRKYCEDNYFTLQKPSKIIEGVEEFVEISFKEDSGRGLVLTKDVVAGTLLAVEPPYVTVLENVLKWDTEHCHCCSLPIIAGIPCKSCTFTLYCSEECRDKSAAGFHKYEHNYLSHLHSHQTSLRDIMAARVIGRAGPRELFQLFVDRAKNPEILSSSPNRTAGFNTQGLYEPSSYFPVYHLASNLKDSKPAEAVANTFTALTMLHLFSETSDFFSQLKKSYTDDHSEKDFKVFIASLILHHMENTPLNVVPMTKISPTENSNEIKLSTDIKKLQFGTALYSLLSLCNHACAPNAMAVAQIGLQKAALVSMENLKAGDEILISYYPLFTLHSNSERKSFLLEKYHFDCKCSACAGHWSPLTFMSSTVTEKLENSVVKEETEKIQPKLKEAKNLISYRNFDDAVETLKPCIEFYSLNCSPVVSSRQAAVDLFKWTLIWLANQ